MTVVANVIEIIITVHDIGNVTIEAQTIQIVIAVKIVEVRLRVPPQTPPDQIILEVVGSPDDTNLEIVDSPEVTKIEHADTPEFRVEDF